MERLTSDGVTLAFLGAMAGALIAQLPEFQPVVPHAMYRAVVLGVAILALCVATVMSARYFIRSSRYMILSIVFLGVSATAILWPELTVVSHTGFNSLEAADVKSLSIKVVMLTYVFLWGLYYAVFGVLERPRG